MPFFANIFKGKDAAARRHARENGAAQLEPAKPQRWDDAWQRKEIEPEEVQELLSCCTQEIKSRALDMPFLLLPFRPASDPSAARTFVRNFFNSHADKGYPMAGEHLEQELRLIEPLVLCSVMKWCWSRLPGGVVTWEAYELFKLGEQDSNTARDAFATFIPISVASDARTKIIFDFFDVMAAVAAHGKTNGLGGRKLSRLAGWWAFEHTYGGTGFDGGYQAWIGAADATSHLFFAYLRSLSPDSVQGKNGISALPLSLQNLLESTEYPPSQTLLSGATSKVVMIVDTVSPTPFALLRRAKHFEYRDEDAVLQRFSDYDDPVQALTDECRRVLKSISSANDSSTTKTSTSLRDASWSRFEDIGFSGFGDESDEDEEVDGFVLGKKRSGAQAMRSNPYSKTTDLGRPTTPSWADFLSSGFVDESKGSGGPLLLPPDKILPPINTRGQSSQSHKRMTETDSILEPGELASIARFELDDAFWWVWISSLAGEETVDRKAVFGRCALIETNFRGGNWLLLEEIIKGAAPDPANGAYIAEKRSRNPFSKRGKLSRSRSSGKHTLVKNEPLTRSNPAAASKASIAPDQHARIQAAAAALQQKKNQVPEAEPSSPRRARYGDATPTKTNSVFTLQPVIMSEAAPAMKWASSYDKNAIRAQYLGDNFAGKGSQSDLGAYGRSTDNVASNGPMAPPAPPKSKPLVPTPARDGSYGFPRQDSQLRADQDRSLPAVPQSKSQTATPSAVVQDEWQSMLAPLPATPTGHLRTENRVAAEAAQVPLPAATPAEYPGQAVREAAVTVERMESVPAVNPAEFASGPEYSEQAVAPEAGVSVPVTNLEPAVKPEHKKLKKKANAGGGIKGFFGRKKPEEEAISAPTTSAVAAARAALEAKQKAAQAPPPAPAPTVKASRRLSAFGKKSDAPAAHVPIAPAMPAVQERPVSAVESTPLATPRYSRDDYQGSQGSLSRVDTGEQRRADRAFRTFDQGPLDDVPAFVPDDSPRESQFEATAPQPETHRDDVSRPSEDAEDNRPISPLQAQDRWAQIRKNAAERAARLSEEQSQHTGRTDKTDDGETSGEETIESRVARIKARVAELTGNMEAPGATRH